MFSILTDAQEVEKLSPSLSLQWIYFWSQKHRKTTEENSMNDSGEILKLFPLSLLTQDSFLSCVSDQTVNSVRVETMTSKGGELLAQMTSEQTRFLLIFEWVVSQGLPQSLAHRRRLISIIYSMNHPFGGQN